MTRDPKTCDPKTCDPTTCDPETCDPKEAGVQEARGQEARVQEVGVQEARNQEVSIQANKNTYQISLFKLLPQPEIPSKSNWGGCQECKSTVSLSFMFGVDANINSFYFFCCPSLSLPTSVALCPSFFLGLTWKGRRLLYHRKGGARKNDIRQHGVEEMVRVVRGR